MTKNKLVVYASIISIIIFALYSCNKIEKGFISTNLYYLENPLVSTMGSITVSSALITDGSTTPLTVEVTKLVDMDGNDALPLLGKMDSILGFSGNVSYLDSTLALLNAKLTTTGARPFSVNPHGGRIQLTPATQYIHPGTYTLSVKATNIRGSVNLPDACKIIINGSGDTYINYGGSYGGKFNPNTGGFLGPISVNVESVNYSATPINKIIYIFHDKNGVVYNAKKGGISNRVNRWSMKQFDPYYPEILTDSSVEYQFPSVPNQFPVFSNSGINNIPRGTFGVFPAIPKSNNNSGNPIFVFLDMAFFAKGTFIINVKFNDVEWIL